ncbi:hypothetical protein M432DRAFT_669892 [Thermoascus aurantiacus ATCC 26904]
MAFSVKIGSCCWFIDVANSASLRLGPCLLQSRNGKGKLIQQEQWKWNNEDKIEVVFWMLGFWDGRQSRDGREASFAWEASHGVCLVFSNISSPHSPPSQEVDIADKVEYLPSRGYEVNAVIIPE